MNEFVEAVASQLAAAGTVKLELRAVDAYMALAAVESFLEQGSFPRGWGSELCAKLAAVIPPSAASVAIQHGREANGRLAEHVRQMIEPSVN